MKIYKNTGIDCYICGEMLHLVEDITYIDIDYDYVKDIEHWFECPNGCDGEYDTMDDYDDKIFEIIENYNRENYECAKDHEFECQDRLR